MAAVITDATASGSLSWRFNLLVLQSSSKTAQLLQLVSKYAGSLCRGSALHDLSGKPLVGGMIEQTHLLLQVRHCALSLVGEPIMYPEINAILTELHKRHISSFLVTNAQFPDRIRHLVPITQLYVSVDAATRDTLKVGTETLTKESCSQHPAVCPW